jgi:hypothetical protein
MIRKKCRNCGTQYPTSHAGECKVCEENDWGTACDKHPSLNLGGASSCQMCEAEQEISTLRRKEQGWERERQKLEDEVIAGGPSDEETSDAPAEESDDSCCGCIVIIIIIVAIIYFFRSCSWFSDEPEEDSDPENMEEYSRVIVAAHIDREKSILCKTKAHTN